MMNQPISPLALPVLIAVDGTTNAPLATRAYAEPPHPFRSPCARDGARVLHSRAFRRLAGKTQVFSRRAADAVSDHFRSRLTHTLEVAQIARSVAGVLGLNTELAETLALVHDIGHPPFGHAGEKALDACLRVHGLRFDHNLHALRIVTWFEERYAAFRGLNLTLAVREGIIKHSRDYRAADHPELAEYFLDEFPPLEAQLIDLADEIAYLTADLDDGIDSGLLTVAQCASKSRLFGESYRLAKAAYPAASEKLLASETLRGVLGALATNLAEETVRRVRAVGATTLDDIRRAPSRLATLGDATEALRKQTKEFLYANLYTLPEMEEVHADASRAVENVFHALMADPSLLPADHQAQTASQGTARTVADYIAGMTDSYLEELNLKLSGN